MAKVSINKFEKALNANYIEKVILNGTNDVEISVKKVLPFSEAMDFTQEVVNMCVDTENGDYVPEAYDMAVRMYTLVHYADFSMPANIEKVYWLLYNTGAYEQVLSIVDKQQYDALIAAIDNKIVFLTDMIKSTAVHTMDTIAQRLEGIVESAEKSFGALDTDTLNRFAQNVMNGGKFNEKKTANTIIALDKFKGNS